MFCDCQVTICAEDIENTYPDVLFELFWQRLTYFLRHSNLGRELYEARSGIYQLLSLVNIGVGEFSYKAMERMKHMNTTQESDISI